MLKYIKDNHLYRSWKIAKERGVSQCNRIRGTFPYARDYAYVVFQRYERRFGYLPRWKASDRLRKIMDGNWYSRARLYMPETKDRYLFATGVFCPVGKIGGINNGFSLLSVCDFCGSTISVGKGVEFYASKQNSRMMMDVWSIDSGVDFFETNRRNKDNRNYVCDNKHCEEVADYMLLKHKDIKAAGKLGIRPNRPVKKISQSNSKQEMYVLAVASFLDFQARYRIKASELN